MKTSQKLFLVLVIKSYLTIQIFSYKSDVITLNVKENKANKIENSDYNYNDDKNNNTDLYDQYPDKSYYYDNYEESDSAESQDNNDEDSFNSLIDSEEYIFNNTATNGSLTALDTNYEDYIFPIDNKNISQNFVVENQFKSTKAEVIFSTIWICSMSGIFL